MPMLRSPIHPIDIILFRELIINELGFFLLKCIWIIQKTRQEIVKLSF